MRSNDGTRAIAWELQYNLKFSIDPKVFNKINKNALNLYYAVTLSSTYSAKYCAKYKGIQNMNWAFKMSKAELPKAEMWRENLCT